MQKPEGFNGERGTLRLFLTQMRLYLLNNAASVAFEADKICMAATFLRKEAFDWFDPMLTDWLHSTNPAERKTETNTMFSDYRNFEKAL